MQIFKAVSSFQIWKNIKTQANMYLKCKSAWFQVIPALLSFIFDDFQQP